jgi:hypothetical protein
MDIRNKNTAQCLNQCTKVEKSMDSNSDNTESELHLKMIFVTITKEIQKHINVGALKAAIKFVKEKNNNSYLNMRNYLAGNLSVHLC